MMEFNVISLYHAIHVKVANAHKEPNHSYKTHSQASKRFYFSFWEYIENAHMRVYQYVNIWSLNDSR